MRIDPIVVRELHDVAAILIHNENIFVTIITYVHENDAVWLGFDYVNRYWIGRNWFTR
jgi:hypothetical protein